MGQRRQHDPVPDEYWSWAAVALYLLLTVDLLTSMYAASAVGLGSEANPVMAWLLAQPIAVIVGVHICAAVTATLGFHWLRQVLQRTPDARAREVSIAVQLWLGLLVATGLVVFANNLAVIVHGRSLFG